MRLPSVQLSAAALSPRISVTFATAKIRFWAEVSTSLGTERFKKTANPINRINIINAVSIFTLGIFFMWSSSLVMYDIQQIKARS